MKNFWHRLFGRGGKSATPLNALAAEIHQTAKDKGWWRAETRNFGELIALMHSELSEALEAYRSPGAVWFYFKEDTKPEGVGVELADCMIRILDTMAAHAVDIDMIMQAKMDYNKTRPYRHGGKKA